jgi:D-serine deaminase-like pyridoxal phosphate-dependent protein
MNRRRLLLSGLGVGTLGALGALALRPSDHGAPHANYFQQLTRALRAQNIATPTLIIDRARMLANADTVQKHIGGKLKLRLVAKSLPSLNLLDQLMRQMQTERLMVFNLPQLIQLANERPKTDLLLGKPLPVAAAAQFYQALKPNGFDPSRQLQWLIDSHERLAQYQQLAKQLNIGMRVNLEIDVGLHRGGVETEAQLKPLLDLLQAEPRLQWSGMMGYDAHIPHLPDLPGVQAGALSHAKQVYRELHQAAIVRLDQAGKPSLCLNAAGSPTYRLHDASGTANELAIGSAMVKGSDFDTELLQDVQAACFIATPVIKAQREFLLPYGAQAISRAVRWWDKNQERAYFVYGGHWLADPVSPPGIADSGLFGHSSNQQIVVGSGSQHLQVDDYVFFRPRQSEAVLLQFGPIAVYENGQIREQWQPMAALP